MIDTGWYREEELSDDWGWQLYGTRHGLPNLYAHIPLHMMSAYARQAGVDFFPGVEASHPIPADLVGVQAAIWAAVSSGQCHSASAWFGKDPSTDPDWHKWLRNRYLHFSALYGWAAKNGTARPNFYPPHPTIGHRVRGVNRG